MDNSTIFVSPFLASRISRLTTSPFKVQRPTSSVTSPMGMWGSWITLP